MKKRLVISLVILLIVIAVVIGIKMMNAPIKMNNINNTQNSANNIQISGYAFNPSTLTINVGESVSWINKDTMAHTVTSDTGTELNSTPISNGRSYTHTFSTAGTFSYHCTIHPSMKATIVVK